MKFGLFLDGASSNLSAGFWTGGPWHQVSEPVAFPTLSWQHVAGSYDGQKLRVYRNGVKVGEAADSTGLPGASADPAWHVGRSWYGDPPDGHWNGMVDDLAVYSSALSDNEIRIHAGAADTLGDACDPCPDNPDPSCAPATCVDADGDGYGIQGASNCGGHPGLFDCNDGNAGVHPGVTDGCDGIDNDCDGVTDEDCAATTYAYDRNGNQTGKVEPGGGTTYTYDARDRMVGVSAPSGSASYAYDTQNLRVRMTDAGGDRGVLLDGIEEMAEYGAGGGARAARYEHDPSRVDALLAQVTGAGKVHAFGDALGSVYGLVNEAGAARARYGYDAFGARSAALETVATNWGFTGRSGELDSLLYARARRYETSTGRWLNEDPVNARTLLAGLSRSQSSPILAALDAVGITSPNRYAYVGNMPTTLTDPTGGIGPLAVVLLIALVIVIAILLFVLFVDRFQTGAQQTVPSIELGSHGQPLDGAALRGCPRSVMALVAGMEIWTATLPTGVLGAAVHNGRRVYVSDELANNCMNGYGCQKMHQVLVGEWQHTQFGGGRVDDQAAQDEWVQLVGNLGIGPPLPGLRHGAYDAFVKD